MIELGLSRIAQLAPPKYTWKAIHVAGTNGKGSICAYLSAMIKEAGLRPARFNSPHLIDRWDCISIDEVTVKKDAFDAVEASVKARNKEKDVDASEFELLTTTAFELFNRCRPEIDYGVIEVGLGGRLDATNILNNVEVSIITKIGLDHQVQLGNTIQEIAREKAGIMRPQVPCIVDGTNEREVLDTLQAHAEKVGAPISLVTAESRPQTYAELQPFFKRQDLEPHQKINLLVATEAMKTLIAGRALTQSAELKPCMEGILKANWPGRLQRISVESLTGRKAEVLLDGAHNVQSSEALAAHVDRTLRTTTDQVTWVFGASRGKDISSILRCCLHQRDRLVPVTFGPVDGMPWVHSMAIDEIAAAAGAIETNIQVVENDYLDMDGLLDRLRLACDLANEGPLVIAGSLYLVSDILRLLRDSRSV